jgi:ABC-type Fe3+ transport system substrate-binding protein
MTARSKFVLMRRALVLSLAIVAQVPSIASAQDWQAGAGDDWKRVLAQARQEGKVVVAALTGELSRTMPEAFKRDTGIEMEFVTATTGALQTRLEREVAAGNVTIDVAIGGGSEVTIYYKGNLVPIKPQLILPGVLAPESWVDGKPHWLDNAGAYMYQGTNWVHGWPIANPKANGVAALASWKDLLKPEFRGKIAAFDPLAPGPGQAIAAYLVEMFGIDFLKQLYLDQRVVYTRDSRQLAEWIARGTYAVGLGAVQSPVELYRSQGLEILVPTMKDGPGYLIGGFSLTKQVKGAPHPYAAQVFHNWFASKNGSEIFSEATLEASTRKDVNPPAIPDYIKPVPGVKYINQYDENWYVKQRPQYIAAVIAGLGGR